MHLRSRPSYARDKYRRQRRDFVHANAWPIIVLACLTAGAVLVPLYPTSPADQVRHILADSGSKLIFLAGQTEWERVESVRAELPDLQDVVSFTTIPGTEVETGRPAMRAILFR